MACPSGGKTLFVSYFQYFKKSPYLTFKNITGCLNGGAQLRPYSDMDAKILTSTIEASHSIVKQLRVNETRAFRLLDVWISGSVLEEHDRKLRTTYKSVPKSTNALTVKW